MTESAVDTDKTVLIGDKRYTFRQSQIYDDKQQPVQLRPKSFRMVEVLLARRGQIVSKEELASSVWPDSVATDESISRCVSDIRKAFGDSAHNALQTFPKRGYQLNASAADATTIPDKNIVLRIARFFSTRHLLAHAIGLLLALSVFVWLARDSRDSVAPIRARLAVLPFEFNQSSDDAEYLAITLRDDLAKQLSHFSALDILPASASDIATDLPGGFNSVMNDLNVGYLLGGEISGFDDKVEILVQLIASGSNTPLWTGRYIGQEENVLDYRNQLLTALAQQLDSTISERDLRQLESSMLVNPLAYKEISLGRLALSTFNYKESLAAERHFRRAVELDANYAAAYAELASVFVIRLENDWTLLTPADEERAMHYAHHAAKLDPSYWFAEYVLGRLYAVMTQHDLDAAEDHLKKAMLLNPASDDARVYYAAVKNFRGTPNEALPIFEAALESHPRPPFWYYLGYGHALFLAGRYNEAKIPLSTCLDQMPTAPYCLRFQIANYAQLGEFDEAAWSLEEYRILGFNTSISDLMAVTIDQHPDNRNLIEESYRKAGLVD